MSERGFAKYRPEDHGQPATGLTVHEADEGDLDAVSAVAAACDLRTDRLIASTRGRILDPNAVIVIATLPAPGPARPAGARGPGEAVGWSGVAWWEGGDGAPTAWYVCGLMVAPHARRRGVAAALLAACADWTSSKDDLWSTCNARNRASIALHEKFGFVAQRHGPRFGSLVFEGGDGILFRRPT